MPDSYHGNIVITIDLTLINEGAERVNRDFGGDATIAVKDLMETLKPSIYDEWEIPDGDGYITQVASIEVENWE